MTEITQADRDAAAQYDVVEAFARHRQYGYDQGYYDGRQADGAEERAKIVAWVESLWPFPHHFCIPAKHIAMGIDSGFYETFTRSDDT